MKPQWPCIRFSTTYWPSSLLIRLRTDSPFSHVEFEMSDGGTFGARLDGGVSWRPKSESSQTGVLRATFGKGRETVGEAVWWASQNRDRWPYDVAGIFGLAFGVQDWHNKKTRFCSELIAEAAEAIGLPLLGKLQTWQVTPRDVAISPLLTFYEAP